MTGLTPCKLTDEVVLTEVRCLLCGEVYPDSTARMTMGGKTYKLVGYLHSCSTSSYQWEEEPSDPYDAYREYESHRASPNQQL